MTECGIQVTFIYRKYWPSSGSKIDILRRAFRGNVGDRLPSGPPQGFGRCRYSWIAPLCFHSPSVLAGIIHFLTRQPALIFQTS